MSVQLCHISNGLLVTSRIKGAKEIELVIVPKVKRKEIFELVHDRSSGHIGISKTIKKIKQCFYWPKLRKEVENYIKLCQNCQGTKFGNTNRFAETRLQRCYDGVKQGNEINFGLFGGLMNSLNRNVCDVSRNEPIPAEVIPEANLNQNVQPARRLSQIPVLERRRRVRRPPVRYADYVYY